MSDMETGMYLFFLSLLVFYNIVYPLIQMFRHRKNPKNPLAEPLSEMDKIIYYKKIMAFSWGQVLVISGLCLFAGISFYDIGFRGISLNQATWLTALVFSLCGIYLVANIYDMVAFLRKPEYREEQKGELAKAVPNGSVNNLLPRSRKERKYWSFVSLTAGICEEITFRGFLFFLLQMIFPNMPMLLILAVTSVVFGVAHMYQGVRGMIRTGLVGALFGGLFLVTGSLIPAMFLHFISDISSVFLFAEET